MVPRGTMTRDDTTKFVALRRGHSSPSSCLAARTPIVVVNIIVNAVMMTTVAIMTIDAANGDEAEGIKPEDDFQGYMEALKRQEMAEQAMQDRMREHEIWRQTTWGGWAVRQLQSLGNHFAPFFEAIVDLMNAEENSTEQVLMSAAIRILMILGYVLTAYAFAKMLNAFLGKEIVIEEEVIIEHDDDEDEEGKDDGGNQQRRAGGRDNKQDTRGENRQVRQRRSARNKRGR